MYTPDRIFMKDLKRLDSRLGIKFNGRNFVITYARGYGDPVNVWVVKAGDGGFRQPDSRDLEALHRGDLAKMRPHDYLEIRSQYFEREREKLKKRWRETARDLTKDNKRQLQKAFERVYDSAGIEIPLRKPKPRQVRGMPL